MRIHSGLLTGHDLYTAAAHAGVEISDFERHGSRSRGHAFEVKLTGSSPYAQNGGQRLKAARWDEWGVFLFRLFNIDPIAIAGPYKGRAQFLKQTREDSARARKYSREGIAGRDYKALWLRPFVGSYVLDGYASEQDRQARSFETA